MVCLTVGLAAHMARGIHGLPKVLPGPLMPNPSMPCRWAISKQPYSHFKGGPPSEQAACSHPLPFWTPHTVWVCQRLRIRIEGIRKVERMITNRPENS